MSIKRLLTYVHLLSLLTLAGCQAMPATPEEALNHLPEYVPTPVGFRPETASIASTVDAAGGKVIVYQWTMDDHGQTVCHLAAAYVTPDGLGWKPQSTQSLDQALDGRCQGESLLVGTLTGSEASALTAVFGKSASGVAVRLTWPDGQAQVVPITNGVFVQARPEEFSTCDLELLDEFGNVIERESLT